MYFTALICNVATAEHLSLENAKERVQQAINIDLSWDGPQTGPTASRDKNIIFIASDLRNGGVNGVAKGVSEAVSHLDWSLRFLDGTGSETRQGAIIRKAISFLPDGIILGGIDAKRHESILQSAKKLGITVVGWHSLDEARGDAELGVFTNITTDALEVAEIAALLAIVGSDAQAKVVIFTDPNYSIALSKADRMAKYINACEGCELISVEHVPLANTAQLMPDVIGRLLSEHQGITHFLTINDLYIDFSTPSLEASSLDASELPLSISAGDGSPAAYKRIRGGKFQQATVPEPLILHGWQIIDELNRAFHHLEPSGFSAAVHLVTEKNISEVVNMSGIYDPDNGYRQAYLAMWKGH